MAHPKIELDLLTEVLPQVAAQLRGPLANLHVALNRIAAQEAREQDPSLDQAAALLEQSYYSALRVVNNLTAAGELNCQTPLPAADGDIVEVCRQLCAKAEMPAELLGLTLRFESRKSMHIIAFHRSATERILYNLLSNAMKFTAAGGTITVSLRVDCTQVRISVTDNGMGIPAERQEAVFSHYLLTDRMDPPPHGLGLGLPLSMQLARRMGGTMLLESAPGQGSCVTLQLPNHKTNHTAVRDPSFDYAGGFNQTLLELADAMPAKAFFCRCLD